MKRHGSIVPSLLAPLAVLVFLFLATPLAAQSATVIRAVDARIGFGKTGSVAIQMDAQGIENAAGFTLVFDPTKLTFGSVVRGAGLPSTAAFNVNSSQAANGRVGIALARSSGEKFAAGTLELAVINFTGAAALGTTPITFEDGPVFREVSDASANRVTTTFTAGTVLLSSPPVATADNYQVSEDTSLGISAPGVLGNDSGIDASLLKAVLVTHPARGTVTLNADGGFTYVPNPNFSGTDSFAYKVSDGEFESTAAAVTITVLAVNDAPVAQGQNVVTEEDTPRSIALTASDVEGDALTFAIVSQPTRGTLSGTAPNLIYTPNAHATGTDSFTFKANDGQADSNVATVNLTISPVNDAPVALADAYQVAEDSPLVVAAPGVLSNDSDVEGASLTALLIVAPARGSLTLNSDGSFSYSPNSNFHGTDRFIYRASDGVLDSTPATVVITVTSVNDPPVAHPQSLVASASSPKTIQLLASEDRKSVV